MLNQLCRTTLNSRKSLWKAYHLSLMTPPLITTSITKAALSSISTVIETIMFKSSNLRWYPKRRKAAWLSHLKSLHHQLTCINKVQHLIIRSAMTGRKSSSPWFSTKKHHSIVKWTRKLSKLRNKRLAAWGTLLVNSRRCRSTKRTQ